MLTQTDDPSVLSILAAGPLEDLIAFNGAKWIDQVESEAQSNPRFKALLRGVWQNTTPDGVWKRVLAARGEKPEKAAKRIEGTAV